MVACHGRASSVRSRASATMGRSRSSGKITAWIANLGHRKPVPSSNRRISPRASRPSTLPLSRARALNGDHTMADTIKVGLVGYKFMGKSHSNAYRQVAAFYDVPLQPEMTVLAGRDEAGVRAAAEQLGWKEYATDWRKVVERQDIGLIDIST